ncbi:O-antigen ligase family protein [Haloflavibacter putidus]|nr:O-antigen ligase family protein [Haloflavibacter putidus]
MKVKVKLLKLKYKSSYFFLLLVSIIALSLNFFGEILNGMFQLGVTDELAILLVYGMGFLVLLLKHKLKIYQPEFIIIFSVLSFIYLLFYYENFISFFYEYYKLMVFMCFIPFLNNFRIESISSLLLSLRRYFIFVLGFNFIFIILQIYTDNQILAAIGYSELRVSGWTKIGRFTGLFDVGTLGATALIMLLLNEMPGKKNKAYYILLVLGILSILFSSSKTSYIIFIVWILILYRRYLLKHFIKIAIAIASFIAIAIYYTYDAIISKIEQYTYFFKSIEHPFLINLGVVEMRAMFWAQAIKIFLKHPFGLGLGTFGDASANYNPNAFKMSPNLWPDRVVVLSDSSLSHLLAEQGLVALIYLLLVVYPLAKAKKLKTYAYMLLSFYFIQIPFTMGFSAGTWPLLFALAYAIIYYEKKFGDVSR